MTKIAARNDFISTGNSGNIVTRGCNSITFLNQGNVVFFINGVLRVVPGQSISLSQVHPDIVDETEYKISFRPDHPASTGTEQNCVFLTSTITQQNATNGTTSGGNTSCSR